MDWDRPVGQRLCSQTLPPLSDILPNKELSPPMSSPFKLQKLSRVKSKEWWSFVFNVNSWKHANFSDLRIQKVKKAYKPSSPISSLY